MMRTRFAIRKVLHAICEESPYPGNVVAMARQSMPNNRMIQEREFRIAEETSNGPKLTNEFLGP